MHVLASPIAPDHLLNSFGVLGLAIILFAECGLLIGFFLPGDTLLLAAGIALAVGTIHTSLAAYLIVAPIAAILGNLVGYLIGRRAGPMVFDRPNSRLFRPEYVTRSEQFFERFGWATVFLARFVPIVRTVATVMAGVGKMPFGRYAVATIAGGIVWADGVLLLGHALGHIDWVRAHKGWLDYIVVIVVIIGLVPTVVHWVAARRRSRSADRT
ncbi:MAG TPA: DedA family protein [Jatrophihabitantaceae bacterium]